MTTPEAARPGGTFGRYRIEEKLGEGGMGQVCLAYDPQLDRRVALKIMQLKDDEALRRFATEARASAKLRHPNILPVYEIGELGEFHYFTMEYVAGRSLLSMIRDNPGGMDPRELAGIMKGVAGALAFAHQHGVIHRDVKPANILINDEGTPFLMDFGIAKEIARVDHWRTITGTLLGTPDYMSPEQAKAQKDKIRETSDIFSFGATFYHSLTGKPPFGGDELYEILDAVVRHDPLAPRGLSSAIPPDLETICLRCLEKDPRNRYPTAKALEDDLGRFLEGRPISARPVSAVAKLLRATRKNALAGPSMIGAALLLIATLAVTVTTFEAGRKREAELFSRTAANAERLLAERKFSEAISVVESFEATGSRTKDRAKQLAEEINKQAGQELATLRNELDRFSGQEDLHTKFNALLKFDKAVSANPDSPDAYIYRGIVRAKFGDIKGAIEDSNRAVGLDSRHSFSYLGRGIVRSGVGDQGGANSDFDRAIDIDPGNEAAYFNRGIVKNILGDKKGAVADFGKALSIDSKDAVAYYNRGVVRGELGDKRGAIADYDKAIDLDPNYVDACTNRGAAKSELGDSKGAIADYSKAISLDPRFAVAYANRAAERLQLEDFKGAIADWEKAVKLDPSSEDSLRPSIDEAKAALNPDD